MMHAGTQASRLFSTASVESLSQPRVRHVPSVDAIASSIRLVRVIHVGADADDSSKISRQCASFLNTISTASILDDGPVECSVGCNSEETSCCIKGWKTEQGRLVRTLVGEISLKEDIRPSLLFSHFVLQVCDFARAPLFSVVAFY